MGELRFEREHNKNRRFKVELVSLPYQADVATLTQVKGCGAALRSRVLSSVFSTLPPPPHGREFDAPF